MHPHAVSVIVPAYRASGTLPDCLKAIGASRLRPDEVIVVSDGGEDDETNRIAHSSGARVVSLSRRVGPGGARNAGVSEARGDLLVFVDADVCVQPEAIGTLTGALERDPKIDAVFGSYDSSPPRPNIVSQYRNLLHHFVHQRGREDAFTFWAGLGAIRRAAFERIHGFDAERYPHPSIEDIDLGDRLRKQRRPDAARQDRPGDSPETLVAAGNDLDRHLSPRLTLDRADPGVRQDAERPEPGMAASGRGRRDGPRDRRRLRRSPGAEAPLAERPGGASRRWCRRPTYSRFSLGSAACSSRFERRRSISFTSPPQGSPSSSVPPATCDAGSRDGNRRSPAHLAQHLLARVRGDCRPRLLVSRDHPRRPRPGSPEFRPRGICERNRPLRVRVRDVRPGHRRHAPRRREPLGCPHDRPHHRRASSAARHRRVRRPHAAHALSSRGSPRSACSFF